MAIVTSYTAVYEALSSFWQQFFADADLLRSLTSSTEAQLGQAYLDTLEAALSSSLTKAPLFHRDYWKLLVIQQDDLTWDGFKYSYPLLDGTNTIPAIQNTVLAPSVTWERFTDYDVSTVGGVPRLQFGHDPFNTVGFASREVAAAPYVLMSGTTGSLSVDSPQTRTASGGYLCKLTLSDPTIPPYVGSGYTARVHVPGSGVMLPVLSRTGGEFHLDSPVPLVSVSNSVQWDIITPDHSYRVAMWVPEALSDKYWLYEQYGSLVGVRQASSEAYRAMLQTVFEYYTMGPAVARAEKMLRALHGLPADSTDIQLVDQISSPQWWVSAELPDKAVPATWVEGKQASVELVDTVYDDNNKQSRYGDPGFYYGANEDGVVRGRQPDHWYKHNSAYIIFDRILKHTCVGVKAAPGVNLDLDLIDRVLKPALPPHLFLVVV